MPDAILFHDAIVLFCDDLQGFEDHHVKLFKVEDKVELVSVVLARYYLEGNKEN